MLLFDLDQQQMIIMSNICFATGLEINLIKFFRKSLSSSKKSKHVNALRKFLRNTCPGELRAFEIYAYTL